MLVAIPSCNFNFGGLKNFLLAVQYVPNAFGFSLWLLLKYLNASRTRGNSCTTDRSASIQWPNFGMGLTDRK